MKPTDEIYIMTKTAKGHFGKVVSVDIEVVITWVEERDDYYFFGYEPLDTYNNGSFGSATLHKTETRKFGVQKVVGTGRRVCHPRFSPVTINHGRSYTNM